MRPPVRIEKAIPEDLDAIQSILDASFPSPWPREMMREELARPVAEVRVLRGPDAAVVAFVDLWHVADEVHVLNLATAPEHRRRGHARRLMGDVLERARAAGAACVTLELRRSNEAARQLYEGLGFVLLGRRPRYYADTGEDALVMIWRP